MRGDDGAFRHLYKARGAGGVDDLRQGADAHREHGHAAFYAQLLFFAFDAHLELIDDLRPLFLHAHGGVGEVGRDLGEVDGERFACTQHAHLFAARKQRRLRYVEHFLPARARTALPAARRSAGREPFFFPLHRSAARQRPAAPPRRSSAGSERAFISACRRKYIRADARSARSARQRPARCRYKIFAFRRRYKTFPFRSGSGGRGGI